jgi:hypothetical protein
VFWPVGIQPPQRRCGSTQHRLFDSYPTYVLNLDLLQETLEPDYEEICHETILLYRKKGVGRRKSLSAMIRNLFTDKSLHTPFFYEILHATCCDARHTDQYSRQALTTSGGSAKPNGCGQEFSQFFRDLY